MKKLKKPKHNLNQKKPRHLKHHAGQVNSQVHLAPTLPQPLSTLETDDDDDGDDEKCCVCSLFQPAKLANHVYLTFVKWAQYDRKVNGRPCFIGHLFESLGGETNSFALIVNQMRSNS